MNLKKMERYFYK